MTRKLTGPIARMSDSGKIDLLARAVFGDVDDETLKPMPGILQNFALMNFKLTVIMYGGAIASGVVILHFLGVPTQTIWQLASKAATSALH